MQSFLTVHGEYEHKIEINRSVFICNLKGIKSFDEAQSFVKEVKKKYSDATHNCYAIITVDNRQKFFDDGEPSGTAGQPILQTLKNNDINNTIAIVTRYFGGIKLGAAGLVSAYSQAVVEAIKEAKVIKMTLSAKGKVTILYNELTSISNYIRDTNSKLIDTQYTDNVEIEFVCPIEGKESTERFVASLSSGRTQIEWLENIYYSYT